MAVANFSGLWCCVMDISSSQLRSPRALAPVHKRVRVLARLHGLTLGYLHFDIVDGVAPSPAAVRVRALETWGDVVESHLRAEGLAATVDSLDPNQPLPAATSHCCGVINEEPLVSIVIATRNRSQMLGDCLVRLTASDYPAFEIIVVDNGPDDDRTRAVVESAAGTDSRISYLHERRAGVSVARNAGTRAARGEFVGFVDDDVEVEPDWMRSVVRGFARAKDVDAVTGLVCTADISTSYEAYFDAKTPQWSTRIEPAVYPSAADRTPELGAVYPFAAGIFGTGANMAFRRSALQALGGFDLALGPGTHSRGGEDLDLFVRTVLAGGSIAYEPSAVVWHQHRSDEAGLAHQMRGYGVGLTAYLTKTLLARQSRREFVRALPRVVGLVWTLRRRAVEQASSDAAAPPGIVRQEWVGYLYGPIAYLRSRWARTVRR